MEDTDEPIAQDNEELFAENGQQVSDLQVVVNHCCTSLFGTIGLLSDIVIR